MVPSCFVAKAPFPRASTLSFDLSSALIRIKPQKRTATLARRNDADLSFADDETIVGGPLLYDTTVYIDLLQGNAPSAVKSLIAMRICEHSAICLSELTHAFGRLDPRHPDTKKSLAAVKGAIDDIPPHRLHAPTAKTWGEAGVLAGALIRLTGTSTTQGQDRKFLNDALIYLQAQTLGATVLTRNTRDFDFLSQIAPGSRVIFYRKA